MNQKIKTKKGFIQIPLLIGIIASIIVASGIGYSAIEYHKTTKLVNEAEQLTKGEKYDEAIKKLEIAQNEWLNKNLGIKRQEIANEIERNKTLLEAKNKIGIEEAQKETEEKRRKGIAAEVQLETERKITQEEIDKLRLEKQKAEEQWAEAETKLKIEEVLRIGSLLQDYYKEIRDANVSFGGVNWLFLWLNIGASQYNTNFMSDLAKHDLGEPYSSAYHTPYWSAQESTYHSQTQSGSYSYQDAKKILDNVVFLSYTAGVDYYNDLDYEKIRKILNFMHSYLHYENDFNETLRAPVETLGFKSGDCDDWATLASAAFADAGINSAIITVKNKDLTELHVMVLVQSKENLPLYSYSDLTQFGLPSGKWWVIEPQDTLEQQNPEWLAKWNIDSAALVEGIKNTIGGARAETKDAAVKASMDSMRLACEMFYTTNQTYTGCFADPSYVAATDAAGANGAVFTWYINTDGTAYCIQSTLPGGGSWCLDSAGSVGATNVACDGVNFNCAP